MSDHRRKASLKRRKSRSNLKVADSDRPRMIVFRSSKHLYAQLFCNATDKVVLSASTLDKEVADKISSVKLAEGLKATSKKSVHAARCVGLVFAEKAKAKRFDKIVFDRNGFLYHGRIKALADGAREGGLSF